MKTIRNKLNEKLLRAYRRVRGLGKKAAETLKNEDGQFVVDHAVVFVIIIVLGAVAIVLMRTYLQNDLSVLLKNKVEALFNA